MIRSSQEEDQETFHGISSAMDNGEGIESENDGMASQGSGAKAILYRNTSFVFRQSRSK